MGSGDDGGIVSWGFLSMIYIGTLGPDIFICYYICLLSLYTVQFVQEQLYATSGTDLT